jgi:hypothetical protein
MRIDSIVIQTRCQRPETLLRNIAMNSGTQDNEAAESAGTEKEGQVEEEQEKKRKKQVRKFRAEAEVVMAYHYPPY